MTTGQINPGTQNSVTALLNLYIYLKAYIYKSEFHLTLKK
jgi:hypothetical protein